MYVSHVSPSFREAGELLFLGRTVSRPITVRELGSQLHKADAKITAVIGIDSACHALPHLHAATFILKISCSSEGISITSTVL